MSESWGLICDLFLAGTLCTGLFIPYFLISKISSKGANITVGIVLSIFSISHIGLLFYFFQMLVPLNQSLFGYSMQEIIHTLRTANTPFIPFACLSLACIFLIIFSFKISQKINNRVSLTIAAVIFLLFSLIFTLFISNKLPVNDKKNPAYNLVVNKSCYFYRSAISYKTQAGKAGYDVIDTRHKGVLFPGKEFVSSEYPLLSLTEKRDVLSPFFTKSDSLPTIVFVLVEGLGNRFIGDYLGAQFMPFLSDLASKGLYWDNVLSTTERSYGSIPSILASAPYGEKGFAFTDNGLYHFSLLNILGKHDYHSTFFYGQPSWFDQAKDFFYRNGADRIEHAYTFPGKYEKIMVGDYFWGYHDKDLAKRTLEVIDSLPASRRIDFIYTGSMHPPFTLSEPGKYEKRIDTILKSAVSKKNKDFIQKYRDYFASVLFSDDAIRMLIEGYAQRPGFENTIFVITGDHNMSHIPPGSELEKYHVPLIIYSPLVKQPRVFHSVNSHLDITPTLLSFLNNHWGGLELPDRNAFIGKILDTCSHFQNTQPFVFMTQGQLTTDIFSENHLLFQKDNLYKIDENFTMQPAENDSIRHLLNALADDFTLLNKYTCLKNKLIPKELYYKYADISMVVPPFEANYWINEKQEFYNIIHEQPLLQKGIYFFDLSAGNYPVSQSEVPHIVAEIKNLTTQETLLWETFNLIDRNGKVHCLFHVDSLNTEDQLVFNAFFWNEKKMPFPVSAARGALYKLGK
ncbi:LTA synthase family protein [Bacteroidales bacterium OttesenSCG-928-B11]|nr:LTA synthase family protein [Bacteroidales bacterium OttesenSCG-928-B11]